MDLEVSIADLAAPAAKSAGLIVDGVTVKRAGKKVRVDVALDLPEDETGAADIDAIAAATREISAAMDAADLISGAYTLDVGTPGAERPLTELRHFKRARGRQMAVEMADGGSAEGRLVEVDDAVLVIDSGAAEQRIPFAVVRSGSIKLEFK